LKKFQLISASLEILIRDDPVVKFVREERDYTAIPNRELQGFYREIWVQGNSNYML
jgi:hypothetical protein